MRYYPIKRDFFIESLKIQLLKATRNGKTRLLGLNRKRGEIPFALMAWHLKQGHHVKATTRAIPPK